MSQIPLDTNTQPEQPQGNPLQKYFRQPKLYIALPSHGRFYPPGALESTENGEYPVYAMTAKDELAFKTPDALLNGQATVDVIQSCMPNIKDAWNMPSVDIDACLIAIRMATYGDEMTITTKIPGTGEERDYAIDLKMLLDGIVSADLSWTVYHRDMRIDLRPLSYREFTKNALKTFEEQRIVNIVNNDTMPDEEKLARFATSFQKLTGITVSMVSQGVQSITVDNVTVDQPEYIKEFIDNADKEFFTTIVDHLDNNKKQASIKPMLVKSEPEDIEAGAPEQFEVPITFDASNFFG